MRLFTKMAFLRILIYLVVALLAFWAFVRFLEATTLFLPSKKIGPTPQDIGLPYEDIYFKTQDGVSIHAWLVKSLPSGSNAPTLLFCHGNAGNVGHRLDKIVLFHQKGLNVFIFDYRGYGKSAGFPSEKGVYRDALAAFDYLKARGDINPKEIIAYGESLGCAVAVDMASRRDVAGLIADSCFSTGADMAKTILPFVPPFFLSIKFDNVAKVGRITAPKLFIHSVEDDVVPYALGRKLYNAAPEPKQFLQMKGDHNEGFLFHKEDFVGGITEFLKSYQLL